METIPCRGLGSSRLESIKLPRLRRLAKYALVGFLLQQFVAMGLGGLGVVHSYYDIALGPHTIGWPMPPRWIDRAWIGFVGPALFPMPDPGSGDNGDRGASSGLDEDDRSQQRPFLVEVSGDLFIVWRAPRGRLLGVSLGEQWAAVGPIDSTLLDAFLFFDERFGVAQVPVALLELQTLAVERAKLGGTTAHDEPAEFETDHAREQAAQEEVAAGRMSESELSSIVRRPELRRSVDAYLRAFGQLEFDFPSALCVMEQREPTKAFAELLAKMPNTIVLRTTAAWGWPITSVQSSASYAWNGTFGPNEAATLFKVEAETASYDMVKEDEWEAELRALVSAVPSLRADGKPLWIRRKQDWIPLPTGSFASLDGSTFVPGVPWKPLWMGALVNAAFYAIGVWFVWTALVQRALNSSRRWFARRSNRCASCGYPIRVGAMDSSHRDATSPVRCPECGAARD